MMYLIESMEHTHGDLKVWWKPDSMGYTTDLGEAGRYSREEADRICRKAGEDNERAWSESEVFEGRAGAVRMVVLSDTL